MNACSRVVHLHFKMAVEVTWRCSHAIDLKTEVYRGRSVLGIKALAFYLSVSAGKILLIYG